MTGVGWKLRGNCTATDPDDMFVTGAKQQQAKQICRGCPVRMQCLAYALDRGDEWGVYGGMTSRERNIVLRQHPDVTSWRRLFIDAGWMEDVA